jgi:glycosyltransferase involved in cell wall biosynthesis
MRIAQMVSGTDVDGAVQCCLMLTRALAARGHDVTLLHAPGARIAALAGDGIRRVEIRFGRERAELRRIAVVLRDLDIDVLHTHRTGASNVGVRLRRMTSVPVVATLHSGRIQVHWLFNDRVIALSARTFRRLRRLHPFGRDRIALIPNFIDTHDADRTDPASRSAIRASLGIPADAFAVGCVGVVSAEKRQRDLVAALKRVRDGGIDGRLVLIGVAWRGEDERIRRKAESLGIASHVALTGPREDARALLPAFDVYASGSSREEMPIAVMEAMAAGLPVVSTDVGSLPLLVSEGVNGFLTPVGAASAIGDRLTRLASSPGVRAAMGAASRQKIVEFSPAVIVPRIEQTFADAAADRGRWKER